MTITLGWWLAPLAVTLFCFAAELWLRSALRGDHDMRVFNLLGGMLATNITLAAWLVYFIIF